MSKKYLLNRIRGWFPQEPHLISASVKMDSEIKQPPTVIKSEYNLSATKFAGAFALFWILFYGFVIFTTFSPGRESVLGFQVVSWIIAGLIFGIITGAMCTKNQLNRLSKEYQILPNRKDMILLFVSNNFILYFLYFCTLVYVRRQFEWSAVDFYFCLGNFRSSN